LIVREPHTSSVAAHEQISPFYKRGIWHDAGAQ